MPHVPWELQGWQKKAGEHKAEGAAEGHGEPEGHGHKSPFELVQKGKLSADEYDKFVGDLVNFMAYAAEPGRSQRQSLGFKAIVYLLVLLAFTYLLKKEYWKDVH